MIYFIYLTERRLVMFLDELTAMELYGKARAVLTKRFAAAADMSKAACLLSDLEVPF